MIRIAVSAERSDGLDAPVAEHFGRCPYFVFVDIEGSEIQAVTCVENPFYAGHVPGAVPQFIGEQGANVMLTGGMGGRAIGFFQEAGIEPATGASGTVRAAIEAYLGGRLSGSAACAESQAHGH